MDQTPFVPSGSENLRQPNPQGAQPEEVDAELVRQVADRVYRLLMQDLKYEQERLRQVFNKTRARKGGR